MKLPFEEAVRKEVDFFIPLFANPNSRNKIDFFFLATSIGPRLVKVDQRQAVKADRLAVIGAGLMGRGIAQVAADKGMRVTVLDVDEQNSRAAVDTIDQSLEQLVAKGRWSRERKDKVMSNVGWTTDYGVLKDIPVVIECVFEDLPLKRKVLAQVQGVNPRRSLPRTPPPFRWLKFPRRPLDPKKL